MLVSASGLWVKTSFGLTAFGRSLPVIAAACVSKIECNPVVATDSINWSVSMQMGGQVHAVAHCKRIVCKEPPIKRRLFCI